MNLFDNFPYTCTIYRRRESRDVYGTVNTLVAIQTGVACWAQNASNSEIDQFSKRGISISHKIYFKTNPNVDERHTLLLSDGTSLDVVSISGPDAAAGRGVVFKVLANISTDEDSYINDNEAS